MPETLHRTREAETILANIRLLIEQGDRDRSMRELSLLLSLPSDAVSLKLVMTEIEACFAGTEVLLFSAPAVFSSPMLDLLTQQSWDERQSLYSLVVGIRPKRMLEIGRARGGSTVIIASAMKQYEGAKFVSLDPNYQGIHHLSEHIRQKLESYGVSFIDGFSPQENSNAREVAGGSFDCVFIDGDHQFESVYRDLSGIVPYLEKGAYVLLHDAYYAGVADAVDKVISRYPFTDCGLISRNPNESEKNSLYRGQPVVWGGLRLLRYCPGGVGGAGKAVVRGGIELSNRFMARLLNSPRQALRFARRLKKGLRGN